MRKEIFIICLLFIGLIGCRDRPTTTSNYSTPSYTPKYISEKDFTDVCNGSKVNGAGDYDKTAGTNSPILIFYKVGTSTTYQDDFYNFPKDWKPSYSELTKTQLVACITLVSRKESRKCQYEEGDKRYKLIMNDTKYTAKVYEAKTGILAAEKEFNLKADTECPMFEFFSAEQKIEDADYKQPMIDFLKPLVKH